MAQNTCSAAGEKNKNFSLDRTEIERVKAAVKQAVSEVTAAA